MEFLPASILVVLVIVGYLVKFRRTTHPPKHSDEPSEESRAPRRSSRPVCAKQQRSLYHRLQTPSLLDAHAVDRARAWLLQTLDFVIDQATSPKSSPQNILMVDKFSSQALSRFISELNGNTSDKFSRYIQRRTAGGPPELLPTRAYAIHWLERAAPVKLIDGCWLSRLNHSRTPARFRPSTQLAWQIFSEELGDGDISKNHVHLYKKLLRDCGSDLADCSVEELVRFEDDNAADENVWTAATTQLCLGQFPDEFLPEVLGYNLAFEGVAMDTLICAYELKELGLDPQYFNLHITIDNEDCGHTAMALMAVEKYMSALSHEDIGHHWRRVQAGFLLATEISTTPLGPSHLDSQILDIFTSKLRPGNTAHMGCKALIGGVCGMSLNAWMNPESWQTRKYAFLNSLANSRWITKGMPQTSRLYKELEWGGRMFGAFTCRETRVLAAWIQSQNPVVRNMPNKSKYIGFVGKLPKRRNYHPFIHFQTILDGLPSFVASADWRTPVLGYPVSRIELAKGLACATIPMQHALSYPFKAVEPWHMTILRISRLFNGFAPGSNGAAAGIDGPAECSLIDLAQSISSVDNKQPVMLWSQPMGHLQTILDSLSHWPEPNLCFLLGSLQALTVNFLVNDQLLKICRIREGTCEHLSHLGEAVIQELETMKLCEEKDYLLGASFVTNYLRSTGLAGL